MAAATFLDTISKTPWHGGGSAYTQVHCQKPDHCDCQKQCPEVLNETITQSKIETVGRD